MERGPQKNVVDDSMSTTTTEVGRSLKDNDKGPVRDPSLPDEQGDIPMEAVPTRDRAQGKGKGKAVSAKVSKKRATANDNTSAPPTKKRKPVATKGNLPQVVGEAAGTFVIANETPSARQALSGENIPEDAMSLNPLSRATRSSTRKTQVLSDWRTASTTIGTPADAVSSKVNPSLRMSPRKSHPHLEPSSSAVDDSLTAVNETAAEQAAAGAIDSLQAVSSVREASPAFSELSELTELSA
jgi:hypothetical protein